MHIAVKDRDRVYSYFADIDVLLIGKVGETHTKLLAEYGYVRLSKEENPIIEATLYNDKERSFGYIVGEIAYIDAKRTTCSIDKVFKKLAGAGKFKGIRLC